MTCAKGITSGYIPLGAVIVSPRVADPFWQPGTEHVFRHGYTYSGHATACAVALANLDVIEREGLVERVAKLEPVLEATLRPLESHPLVAEVRAGLGLLGAVVELAGWARSPPRWSTIQARGVLTVAARVASRSDLGSPFVVTEDESRRPAGQVLLERPDAAAWTRNDQHALLVERRAAVKSRWVAAASSGVAQWKGWCIPSRPWPSSSQNAAHICSTASR